MPTLPPDPALVSGIVYEHTPAGRRPVPGIAVQVRSLGGDAEGVTDANGKYMIKARSPGTLSITAGSNSEFMTPCPSGVAGSSQKTTFDVHVVRITELTTAGLPSSYPPSSIYVSGVVSEVTQQGTRPVAGALVQLGEEAAGFFLATTLTDLMGRYLVCSTPPGGGTDILTTISVRKDGYKPGSRAVSLGWDYWGADVKLVRK